MGPEAKSGTEREEVESEVQKTLSTAYFQTTAQDTFIEIQLPALNLQV